MTTATATENTTKAAATAAPFAVIESGGKQHIVSVGDTLEVELLHSHGPLQEGDTVTFDSVLMTDDGKAAKVGTPTVSGAKVTATYLGDTKGPKISIIRYKAKSNRDRKIGHRQKYAQVKIEKIG